MKSNIKILLICAKVLFYLANAITLYVLINTFVFSKTMLTTEKIILTLSFCLLMILCSISFFRYCLKEESIYTSENVRKYIFQKILYYLGSTTLLLFAMYSESLILHFQ